VTGGDGDELPLDKAAIWRRCAIAAGPRSGPDDLRAAPASVVAWDRSGPHQGGGRRPDPSQPLLSAGGVLASEVLDVWSHWRRGRDPTVAEAITAIVVTATMIPTSQSTS